MEAKHGAGKVKNSYPSSGLQTKENAVSRVALLNIFHATKAAMQNPFDLLLILKNSNRKKALMLPSTGVKNFYYPVFISSMILLKI